MPTQPDEPPASALARRLALLSALVVLVACGERSEAEIQAEFDAFVQRRTACQHNSDCTLVEAGCPLGCRVAANATHADDIREKARALIEEYESGSDTTCTYNCAPLGPALCRAGHCSAEPIDAGE